MALQDAFDQARQAFSQITSQAGKVLSPVLQGAAQAIPGVSAYTNMSRAGSTALNAVNAKGFASTPLSQSLESGANKYLNTATNLPDISTSVPGISQGFNYLKGLNQQLSQQGPLGKIGSTIAGLPLGIAEGVTNIPTDLVRGSSLLGQQLGNAQTGGPVNYQKALSGGGQVGKAFLNASMIPGSGTGGVAEQTPQSLLGAVKQGALSGAKFGGTFGALQGLQEGQNAQNVGGQILGAANSAAQNALAGSVMGGLLGGEGYALSKGTQAFSEANKKSQGEMIEGIVNQAASLSDRAKNLEGKQLRGNTTNAGQFSGNIPTGNETVGGGYLPALRDQIPMFQIPDPSGENTNGTRIVDGKQLLSLPNWKELNIQPFNAPAQLLWKQTFSGGYVNFGASLGKDVPTEGEIPQNQIGQRPQENLDTTGAVSGNTASGNPLTAQDFERSLEMPTPSGGEGPTALQGALSPQNQNLPSAGISNQGEASTLPTDMQTVQPREKMGSVGQNLQVSSNGSISSPSNQAQIDQIFSKAKLAKDTPLSQGSDVVKAVKDIFDPVAGTVQGADITNAFRDHRGVFDHAVNLAQRDSLDLTKDWQKVPIQDHLKFIQGIESGNPIDIKGIDPGVAQKYQQRFADDYAIQKSIRPDAPYRENYFTQSGVWKDPKQAEQFFSQWQKSSLGGSKGFFEQRSFPTILDGVKAGLELKETNPETLYLNNHTQVLKAKMADDFAKEMQGKGMDQQLVQKVIDRYMDPGISGNAIYKTARAANAALNGAQLGLSAFHFTTTTMNAFTSKMAQGIEELSQGRPLTAIKDIAATPLAPLQQLVRGNKMLVDAFANNPELSTDVQNVLTAGGKFGLADEYKSGAWNGMMKNWNEGKIIPAALKAPFAALEKISSPLMDYYVPRLKLGAFADLASSKLQNLGENATKEQQRAALSQAWDSIDNRFGQLVQDNLLWNKTFKDILNTSTRSLGWNVGTVREIGGGAVNALKAPKQIMSGQGIDSSTAYTLALPIMTSIAATVYSALHGQTPQNVKDFFYPRTGEVKKPTNPNSPDQNSYDERVSIPGYAKDVYAFAKNPVQTVLNKESPLVTLAGKAIELGSTGGIKDYFGNQVVDPNADPLTKAGQVGKFGASQFLPFSVSGQNQRVGQDAGTKVESALGFTPAPAAITKGKNADLLNQTYNEKLTAAQSAEAFKLQNQGLDPQEYISGIKKQQATNKQAKSSGTDLNSQKQAAVAAFLQGDASQARGLGMTAPMINTYINSQLSTAARALVSGDTATAQKIQQQYNRPITPQMKMTAAHDQAMTLLHTAMLYQTQGDDQSASKIIDQVYELKKQYSFRLTPQDKIKLGMQ